MRRCRIESLGVSLPGRRWLRWGSTRHAVEAGRRCLETSKYGRSDVRVLINAGVYRDDHVCEPAIAAYLQHRLDINIEFQGRRTLSFDLLNGGCGMLSALQVLTAMMQDGAVQVGMVIASDANSDRKPDPSYPYPASGAALLVDLSPRRDVGFGAFAFHTREEYAELYTSHVDLAQKRGRLVVKRDAAAVEDAWLACARPAVDEALEKDGLRREDVSLVLPAQVSAGFLSRLPEAIGFPREKVADYTSELPDTLSTSTVLSLARAQQKGAVAKGTNVLLLAFGAGVTAGAAVYRA